MFDSLVYYFLQMFIIGLLDYIIAVGKTKQQYTSEFGPLGFHLLESNFLGGFFICFLYEDYSQYLTKIIILFIFYFFKICIQTIDGLI